MARNDNATLVLSAGNYFTGPVGTARPVDLTSVSAPWEELGHTSLEDILSLTSEGGEATVLGTLQNKTLRTKYSDRSDALNFTLQQFDADSLRLYFGGNMVEVDSDFLGIPTNPTPVQSAFLAVFIDAENVFAFYAPKAEIFRADDFSAGDAESLAGLPLSVRPLQYGSNDWTFAVTPLGANTSSSS